MSALPSTPTYSEDLLQPLEVRPTGPGALAQAALHGIIGDFVRTIGPHTESDPAALAISLLLVIGNYLSRIAYYLADGSKQYSNEFAVIVGDSSKARKGTSWNWVKRVFELLDPDYTKDRIVGGLASGEGLIAALSRSDDMRLMVFEPEFIRVLEVMRKEGNTLSAILREGWDSGNLNVMTRKDPLKAIGAHISIVTHITVEELVRNLSATDSANGFANRFLWIYSQRSKLLPFGGNLPDDALEPIAARICNAAHFAEQCGQIGFDKEAAERWCIIYPVLSEGRKGLAGVLTSRNEAHTVRLAALYAILDLSPVIQIEHLEAALAVVDYSTRSVNFIFGSKLGDEIADEILRLLNNASPDGVTRNDINNHFGRNKSALELGRALGVLKANNLAFMKAGVSEKGRKSECWYAVREKNAAQIELFESAQAAE